MSKEDKREKRKMLKKQPPLIQTQKSSDLVLNLKKNNNLGKIIVTKVLRAKIIKKEVEDNKKLSLKRKTSQPSDH